jgi:hypothetical protein
MIISKSLPLERFWLRVILIGVGAFFLVWTPALNGYPFIYSDSGTYIFSGALVYVPLDRSIGYGVFLYHINLVRSLWGVSALQALGLSYLMFRAAELLNNGLPGTLRSWIAFGIVVATALTTTVSTFVGFISPDIFTSWLFLGGLVFLLSTHSFERILAAAGISLALWVHNSHLVLGGGMIVVLALGIILFRRGRGRFAARVAELSGVVGLTLVAVVAINFYLHAGITLSRGGTTILLNRFVAAGLIAQTLATYCGEQRWVLCAYQAQLSEPHDQPDWFLWNASSPINKVGWDKNEDEQRDLIWHTFQCCAERIITASAAESWKQLWETSSGAHIVFLGDEMNAVTALRRFYPGEVDAFQHSAQQEGKKPILTLLPFDEKASLIFFLALLPVLWVIVISGKESPVSFTIGALLLFLVLNATLVGTLNGASGRYQARINWLVPYWDYITGAFLLLRFAAQISARNYST